MIVRTLEIPKQRWQPFLQQLDRLLANRPIRLEVMGRDLGDQELAERLPFVGIDYDTKGSERDTVSITVEGDNGGQLTHRVVGPTRIYVGQNERGEAEWLAIEESGEGGEAKTLIHFETWPEIPAEAPQ